MAEHPRFMGIRLTFLYFGETELEGFEPAQNSLYLPSVLRFENRDKICDENSIKKEHPGGCSSRSVYIPFL